MSKKTLSLDFDGVCHKYLTPWSTVITISDGPVDGLFPFLVRVDKDFVVEIYSTRSETGAGRLAMAGWLRREALSYSSLCALPKFQHDHLMDVVGRVQFPASKPKAFVGLDDRILTFEGTWPSPETLLGWQPWNKRETRRLHQRLDCDREAFYVLKELLRKKAFPGANSLEMTTTARREMDAARSLYEQIRDQEFPNV